MIQKLLKLLFIILIATSCQNNPNSKQKSNNINIAKKHKINSIILNEERELLISLPDGYEKSNASYPLLVLTDGKQNLKHVVGSIELLTRTGSIPPIIVIGIVSTNRTRDFSPTFSKNSPGSGNGPKFLKFIEKEVLPFVNDNYRAHNFKILTGHSLGGLFTAYTLMENPNLFEAHIILSPSFWWNKEEFIKKSGPFFRNNKDLDKAIYFSIGKDESSSKWGMRKELSKFVDSLRVNKPNNTRFKHQEFENEGHMSSPLLGTYHGLRWVFSDLLFTDKQAKNYSDELFLLHEKNMKIKYGKQAKQSAEVYVRLASYLSNQKRYNNAITVLKRAVEAYDYDIFLKFNLAKAYEYNQNKDMAINTYKSAIKTSKKYKFAHEERLQKEINRLMTN